MDEPVARVVSSFLTIMHHQYAQQRYAWLFRWRRDEAAWHERSSRYYEYIRWRLRYTCTKDGSLLDENGSDWGEKCVDVLKDFTGARLECSQASLKGHPAWRWEHCQFDLK